MITPLHNVAAQTNYLIRPIELAGPVSGGRTSRLKPLLRVFTVGLPTNKKPAQGGLSELL